MKKAILSFALWLFLAGPAVAGGKLLIVGGGLSPNNEKIHKAFLDAIPSGRKLALISAASGTPTESAGFMKSDFARYGFDANNIIHIRLAVIDDKSTSFDESKWHANGDNAEETARLEGVGGVWFTGGDQARILATLKNSDGTDKAMAKRLRAILDSGGIIGGTSAGAAMMSDDMILFGDPLPALLLGIGQDGSGALGMGKGMGFMPVGIVDQHFDERRRLGRLARAISYLPKTRRIGFGIDENTGFVVDLDALNARVVGEGSLTMLDGRAAQFGAEDRALTAADLVVHVFTDGDAFDLHGGSPTIATYKRETIGGEYYKEAQPAGGGIAVPYPGIARYLGAGLVDNSAADEVAAVSFTNDGKGIRYVFQQRPGTKGYWGRDENGRARYSVIGVWFTIEPVQVKIN